MAAHPENCIEQCEKHQGPVTIDAIALNHLRDEQTALCVQVEAFPGPILSFWVYILPLFGSGCLQTCGTQKYRQNNHACKKIE